MAEMKIPTRNGILWDNWIRRFRGKVKNSKKLYGKTDRNSNKVKDYE